MKPGKPANPPDELRSIPGVGKTIAKDLWNIGIRRVADLRGEKPADLYDRMCAYQGRKIDRCMLYVLRCAVYFASEKKHDPKLLQWWNWKDTAPARAGKRGRDMAL